jgi:tetratricopeptide (TPR) repeat protein
METMASPQANVVRVLFDRIANLRKEGKHDEAIRVATTAIDTAGRLVESDESARPHFVTALESLAELRLEQGDYPPAEALLIDALEHTGYCEVPPIQLARMKSSLAGIYDFNAFPESAIPLYEEAIVIFENLDPPLEEDSANLRNNLAMIFKDAGYFDQAEENYIKALEILERLHGRQHEDVASIYNNLGALYYATGYCAQAREMHGQAFEIRSGLEEKNHSDIGQSCSNLATCLHELDETAEAQKQFETALKHLEHTIAHDSELYTIVSSNYATLLRDMNKEKKALALEKRTQKLLKKLG